MNSPAPRRLPGGAISHQSGRPVMRSATFTHTLSTARADALFASALQRSGEPGTEEVRQAIAAAVRAFGTRGCPGLVAQAYGEPPETAAPRMPRPRAAVTRPLGPDPAERAPASGPTS